MLLAATLLLSAGVTAAKIDTINVGRVAVNDQSLAAQTTAGRAALRQVFIKMSGHAESVEHPTLRRAISNYEQYLISSAYVQLDNQLWLEARFNQERIVNLLKATDQPVWANLRPSASMWLAIETPSNEVEWIHQNNAEGFSQTLAQAAFERGVSIILPLGDLDDAKAVSAFDVWTQNLNKLSAQALRYNTDFVISASLKPITDEARERYLQKRSFTEQQSALEQLLNTLEPSNINVNEPNMQERGAQNESMLGPKETDQVQLDWIISNGKNIQIGKVFLADKSYVAKTLVDLYANLLAAQYAVGGADGGQRVNADKRLILHNVNSLSDYHNAQTLISAIPQVSGLSLDKIEGSKAVFSLRLSGQSDEFISLLSLDPRISAFYDAIDGVQANTIQLMWER
jgi:hypothetical protein